MNKTILISAYGCEPLKGSESAVGWNWVLQLACHNKVHVITRSNNREPIELHLPKDIAKNITFHYYDTSRLFLKLKNKDRGLYFYTLCWQIGIIFLAKKILKKYKFDYTMHLTFGSIWMPTFLPIFKIPFIWGPVGGGECIPKSFLKILPWKQRVIQTARYWMNSLSFLNPFVMLASCSSVSIILRTPGSIKAIPYCCRKKITICMETSIEDDVFKYVKKNNTDSETVQLITTGRLIPLKNIQSIIDSFRYIPNDRKFSLTIIGSGPEKVRIKAQIKKYHLSEKVTLLSSMDRQDVLKKLESADIFVFPSLKEGGSWALMEAMAIGLPVICLDWTGMSISTSDESAIRLPVTNPLEMPKDLAKAICKLIDNPDLREQMGEAARLRIKSKFNWANKGEFMENLLMQLDRK